MPHEKRIDGMPRKAIEKLLANPKTPEHLKEAWRRKLKMVG